MSRIWARESFYAGVCLQVPGPAIHKQWENSTDCTCEKITIRHPESSQRGPRMVVVMPRRCRCLRLWSARLQVDSVKPALDLISSHPTLSAYVPALERQIVLRLLKQLSAVYHNVKLSYVRRLIQGLAISQHVSALDGLSQYVSLDKR
jgi:hypothetical protein